MPSLKGKQRKGGPYKILRRTSRGFVSSVDWYCRKGRAREQLSSVISLNVCRLMDEVIAGETAQALAVERQDLGEHRC